MAEESKSRRAAQPPKARAGTTATRRRRTTWRDRLAMDSEQSSRALMIGVVALVLIAAGGFIAFGYWNTEIKPRNRTVLQVDDYKVSYVAMKRRMTYEFFQNITYQRGQGPLLLPAATDEALLEELTLVSRAKSELGVGPEPNAYNDDPEYQGALRTRIGTVENEDPRIAADKLRRAISASGLKESEYRRLVFGEYLRGKVHDALKVQLPPTVPQAKVEVIAAANIENAQRAIERLNAGEAWAAVAKDLSTEVDRETTGGLKPYGIENSFNAAYDDYAFTASAGQISGPLQAPGAPATSTFYVVRVVDRSEQPLTEDQKPSLTSDRYDAWLTEVQSRMMIRDVFNQDVQATALRDVLNNAPAVQPQSQPQPRITAVVPTAPAADATTAAGLSTPSLPSAPVAPGGGSGQ